MRTVFLSYSFFLGLLCLLTCYSMIVKVWNTKSRQVKTQAVSTLGITLMFILYIILGIVSVW